MTAFLEFFLEIVWRIILIIITCRLKKGAIHFLYVWGRGVYNLIARNCSGHGLSEKENKEPFIACLNCVVLFLHPFLVVFICPRTWNARALLSSFVPSPFCHRVPLDILFSKCFSFFFLSSMLLSLHSKDPFPSSETMIGTMTVLLNVCYFLRFVCLLLSAYASSSSSVSTYLLFVNS